MQTEADLMLRDGELVKSASKDSSGVGIGDIELANINADRDVDMSATQSVFSSPRNLLTSTVTQPDINSALNHSRGTLIRHKPTRELERRYRKQMADQKTDFSDFLQFLVQFYRST